MLLWEASTGRGKSSSKSVTPRKVQPISTRQHHAQRATRCSARTRAGRLCRCRRAEGSQFCNFHDPEISARIREKARIKREARKRMLASLPEGYERSLRNVDGVATALDRLYREVRLGVVSPRTATVLMAIVDRMMVYDKLMKTVGPRQANKRVRAQEVRRHLANVLEDLKNKPPAKPVRSTVHKPLKQVTAR